MNDIGDFSEPVYSLNLDVIRLKERCDQYAEMLENYDRAHSMIIDMIDELTKELKELKERI